MLRREFIAAGGSAVLGRPAVAWAQGAPLRPINIISTSGTTNLVIAALMDQMGYMRQLGVAPNYINVADGSKVVAALITGSADLCPAAGITQVLAAIVKGAPLKVLAGAANKNFNAIFSANPGVRTLKDLEGRSVGVGALGTQLHQTMIALFRKYGVDASKVRFANVGAGPNVLKAVSARVVDAGPAEVWLQRGTNLHILEHGKTFESLPEFVNQASFTSQRALAQKRDLVVRALAAYARLYRFIMTGDSQAAFLAASAKALGPAQAQTALDQWRFYRQIQPFAANLELSPVGVQFMQQLNVTTATQTAIAPFARVVDTSVARDALKLIR